MRSLFKTVGAARRDCRSRGLGGADRLVSRLADKRQTVEAANETRSLETVGKKEGERNCQGLGGPSEKKTRFGEEETEEGSTGGEEGR